MIPLDVLELIALVDLESYRLMLSVPNLARRTIIDNKKYRKHFTVCVGDVICMKEQRYYLNGVLHNDDGPAIMYAWSLMWFRYGVLHRDDGPAIVDNFESEWYQYGVLHRIGGPAKIPRGTESGYYGDANNKITKMRNINSLFKPGEEDNEHRWYINGKKVEPYTDDGDIPKPTRFPTIEEIHCMANRGELSIKWGRPVHTHWIPEFRRFISAERANKLIPLYFDEEKPNIEDYTGEDDAIDF